MKILAVCGSKRKNGNTSVLIDKTLLPFRTDESCTIRTIYLGEMDFDGCRGCEGCSKSNRCVLIDDMQPVYDLIREADAVIVGSPTYFYNMSSDMKKFIERCYCFTSFDKDNRSVWVSELDSHPRKFAGFISVCEQNSLEDMGFTPQLLQKSFESLGFRTVFNQKILHCFKAGEVNSVPHSLAEAEKNGNLMKNTLYLQRSSVKE